MKDFKIDLEKTVADQGEQIAELQKDVQRLKPTSEEKKDVKYKGVLIKDHYIKHGIFYNTERADKCIKMEGDDLGEIIKYAKECMIKYCDGSSTKYSFIVTEERQGETYTVLEIEHTIIINSKLKQF